MLQPPKPWCRWAWRSGVLACAMLAACGEAPARDVATTTQAISGGERLDEPAYGSYPAVGLVKVGNICTGTLIDEQHVLTASQCFGHSGVSADMLNSDARKAFILTLPSLDGNGRLTLRETVLPIERWRGNTRDWTPTGPVRLNPSPNPTPAVPSLRPTA